MTKIKQEKYEKYEDNKKMHLTYTIVILIFLQNSLPFNLFI